MSTKDHDSKKAVFALFPSRAAVETAVDRLREGGYRPTDISVLFPHGDATKEFAHENTTKLPEGATAGAISGATVGGVLGWLAGIGSLAIPGAGPFIAAGPIMAALGGMGVGGTVGTIGGALIGLGLPEYEAARYQDSMSQGKILLSVHVDDSDWSSKAKKILESSGGEDIAEKSEAAAKK